MDERLIHGQIVNEWITQVKPTHFIIIDNELVEDQFMANIYKAMAPLWLEVQIFSPIDAVHFLKQHDGDDGDVFLLARTPCVFEEMIRLGCYIDEILLADKKYLPKKRNVTSECKKSINNLLSENIRVIMQEFPSDEPYYLNPYRF